MNIQIRPLEWYEPTDHPQDDDENCVLMAHGIGGRYSISKEQGVGPKRLLWMAHDSFIWQGYNSIAEAKAAAQADYEKRILSALSEASK